MRYVICKYLLPFSRLPFWIFKIVFFVVQKLFSLMSHLFIFAFVSLDCGDVSLKILLRPMSKSVLPMFSSRFLMASGLTLKFLIHFELIF